MSELVAKSSPWRMALVALGGAGFVVIGAWMAGLLGPPPERAPEWAGWLSIVFFGTCAIVAAVKAFDRGDVLRIGTQGIWYRWHADMVIPWSEIEDVGIWEYRRQRVIVLVLRHPDLFPARGIAGALAGANRRMVGGDVAISLTGLDRSVNEALAAIDRFRSDFTDPSRGFRRATSPNP